MNSKATTMRGRIMQLVAALGLMVIMTVNAAAWDITATSISKPAGKSGRMYFSFVDQNNNGVAGWSLPSTDTSGTIHGVPSGSFTLKAFIDTQGTGFQHANDPYFSNSITVSGDISGPLAFIDPLAVAAVTLTAPDLMPLDHAVFVNFRPATTVSTTSNGLPIADKHTIYWGTNSDPGPGNTTDGGSLTIFGQEPMVVISNLVNGTSYYFAVRAENQNSTSTAMSPVSAAVTPAEPTPSASTVNVTVNTTGITKNAQTMLIVVLSDDRDGFVFNYVKNPEDIQVVPVTGVPAGTYKIMTVLNPSGSGDFFGAGNVSNFNENDRSQRGLPITVDGVTASFAAPTITLAVKNSALAVSTSHTFQNGIEGHRLSFKAASMSKQLVNVTLVSGPQITGPIDFPLGSNREQVFSTSLNVLNRPTVGDTYQFTLYYADDTSESRPTAVTAVLDTFPGGSFPNGSTGPASVLPTFGWNNPGNLPAFISTEIYLNSNSINFLPLTTLSAKYQYSPFSLGQASYWSRYIRDLDGNEAGQQFSFIPSNSGPVISSFSPTSGAAGTSVTITGSGFSATPANNIVKFNGIQTATPTSVSPTSLTVMAPASSGVITVTVDGVTAGSIEPFAATTSFAGQITSATDGTTGLSGVAVSLAENPAVTTNTDASGNYSLPQVPAKPYFTLKFRDPGFSPYYSHSALQSVSGGDAFSSIGNNWSLYTADELTSRSVSPASGKGLITARIVDYSGAVSTNYMAGAVVTASSMIHPDVPYVVKYTNGTTTVAQDPATYPATAKDGRFYVLDVDEGDYVSVTAGKAETGWGFQTKVFNTHANGVGSQQIRGARVAYSPTATPAGGVFATPQSVTLSVTGSTNEILYTTNGNDPTVFGTNYSINPLPLIAADTTLKFVAKNKNLGQAFSAVQTEVYTIGAGIAGHVSDGGSSAPLSFVNVQLYDQNGSFLRSINTDSTGSYKFSGLTVNTYKVCFYANQSYASQCWHNSASNPSTATPITTVTAATSQVTGIDAALQSAAIITGQVTNDGTNGIPNIWVGAYDTNGNQVPGIGGAMTDSNGNYSLGSLPSGIYKLYFSGQSTGYISQWYSNKANAASADTLTVAAGNTYNGYNAQLAQGGSFSGQVTSNDSTGISGVSVQLRDTSGNWISGINGTTTNASGIYTFNGIPFGSYKLYFDGSSSGYISQWYDNAPDQSSATAFDVATGSNPSKNAILASGAIINGRATSDGTNGIPNVSVQLLNSTGVQSLAFTSTDASGGYQFKGLQIGTYKVCFTPGQTNYLAQCYNSNQGFDPVNATGIQVTVVPSVVSAGATMTLGGAISGKVTNSGASGIQNISVEPRDASGNWMSGVFNVITDINGDYTVRGIPAGPIKVYFNKNIMGYASQWYSNKPSAANADPVSISAGITSSVNAILELPGSIFGHVIKAFDNSDLAGITVQLYDTGGILLNGLSATTSGAGSYDISGLASGSYKVRFSGSGFDDQWFNLKLSLATSDSVAVTAGNSTGAVNAVLENRTTTTVSISLTTGTNPSIYGQGVGFTATVSPSTATGTVQLYGDGSLVASSNVAAGSALFLPITNFSVGSHTITAGYSGDQSYRVSTSAGLAQSVNDGIKNGSTGNYITLQAAINAALDKNVLLLRDTRFAEDLLVTSTPQRPAPFTITLKGGLSSTFDTPAATPTSVKSLRIQQGKVIAERLAVKPN